MIDDQIEKLYQLIKFFQTLEVDGKDFSTEIEGLRLCLQRLQQEEADQIREQTKKKLKQLEASLQIITQLKETLRK